MFGMLSSARVWWLFRLFGHDRVSILDGGFSAWKKAANHPVNLATALVPKVERQTFKAQNRQEELVKSFQDVEENVNAKEKATFQLIDARPPGNFAGTAPEANKALSSGHIPGAYNRPLASIIDPTTKRVKGKDAMVAAFEGIDLMKPTTTMCTTGITGSNLAFALHLLRVPGVTLYEGGWTEWAQRADRAATGPDPWGELVEVTHE